MTYGGIGVPRFDHVSFRVEPCTCFDDLDQPDELMAANTLYVDLIAEEYRAILSREEANDPKPERPHTRRPGRRYRPGSIFAPLDGRTC